MIPTEVKMWGQASKSEARAHSEKSAASHVYDGQARPGEDLLDRCPCQGVLISVLLPGVTSWVARNLRC
jgi:hypothetical protein